MPASKAGKRIVRREQRDGYVLEVVELHCHTPNLYRVLLGDDCNVSTWLCGYAIFPKRPLREEGYLHTLAQAVPVHGGITYAEQKPEGYAYGFDCAHAGDGGVPQRQDPDWVLAEADRMAKCLLLARQYEPKWLAASGAEREKVEEAFRRACEAAIKAQKGGSDATQ